MAHFPETRQMNADRDTRYARYRQGLCVTCGDREHIAGRPRCNTCHAAHMRGDQPHTEVSV